MLRFPGSELCSQGSEVGFSPLGVMSFVRNREVSQGTLGGLGVLGGRPVGRGGPTVQLPDSLLCHPFSLSGSNTPSELFPIVHPGNRVEQCDGRSAGEGIHQTGSFNSRLLQPPVRYPQGHRGSAAGNRPLPPQPFCSRLPFSHGDSSVGSPVSSSGRLDGVRGSPGRLSSGSCAPVVTALPEVLRGGFCPAVSCSLLRPLDCPAGVHTCHGSYLFHHAPLQFPDPTVSGQLARPRILVSRESAGEGFSPLVVSEAQRPCQPRQELSDSLSDAGLSGDEASNTSFEGFPNPQTCPEALISASRVHVLSAAAPWGDVIPLFHRSGVSSSDAVPSAAPQCLR